MEAATSILSVSGITVGACLAFATAYALTWAARWCALLWGCVDHPDGGRKKHTAPTPLMGGVAVLGAFLIVAECWPGPWPRSTLFAGLAASAVGLCALGLWDDRFGLRARYKFAGQVLAVTPFLLALAGTGHSWSCQVFGLAVPLGVAWWLVVAVWLVGAVNLLNLADGLDGAAGAAAGVSLVAVMAITHTTDPALFTIAALLMACLAGFLVHNLPPARIFLGDAGSMTLGFLIGALLLLAMSDSSRSFHPIPALTVLFIPAWDTWNAVLRRSLQGKGIAVADRGHIHHRLRDHGLSTVRVLFLLTLLHSAVAVAAVVGFQQEGEALCLAAAAGVASGLVVGRVFGDFEAELTLRSLRLLRPQQAPAPQSAQRPVLPITRAESGAAAGDRQAA